VKILRYWDLASKGIPYTRKHIIHLVKTGRFPKPVKLSKSLGPSTAVGWIESEIDEYRAELIRQRDAAA